MTGITLVDDILTELGVYQAGETPSTADRALVLTRVNYVLDAWNAEREKVWADLIQTFTLTPSLNPHTIGPSMATWTTATQRPVSIQAANLIVNTIYTPINVRDAEWFQGLSTPTLSTEIPTDLLYEANWPNGSIYFYPGPSAAYQVQLWTRVILSAVVLDTTAFTLPPGYAVALMLTAAELCCGNSFGVVLTPDLQWKATQARARINANNVTTPTLQTRDWGMPGDRAGWFNYLTGRVE